MLFGRYHEVVTLRHIGGQDGIIFTDHAANPTNLPRSYRGTFTAGHARERTPWRTRLQTLGHEAGRLARDERLDTTDSKERRRR